MLDGELSELGMLVRHINETECGFSPTIKNYGAWPTPKRIDGIVRHSKKMMQKKWDNNGDVDLTIAVKMRQASWPTPTTMDTLPPKSPEALHREATVARPGRSRPSNLRDCVHPNQMEAWNGSQTQPQYLTPQANEDAAGTPEGKMQKMLCNSEAVRGKTPKEWKKGTLNPSWVEWLMGWPIGWTDLKPLATDKFRNVQQWHSVFSQKD
jgi:hypothetical protein